MRMNYFDIEFMGIITMMVRVAIICGVLYLYKKVRHKSALTQSEDNSCITRKGGYKAYILFGLLAFVFSFVPILLGLLGAGVQAGYAIKEETTRKKNMKIYINSFVVVEIVFAVLGVSTGLVSSVFKPLGVLVAYFAVALADYVKSRKRVQKDVSLNLFYDEDENE